MTKRREFIKNATGFAIGTIVLPDFLMANNIFKNHNYNNFNGNNFAADNLLFGDPVIRTIGAEDIIIQAHSLTIDEVFYKGLSKNLHILCYDLRINDDIEIINGKNINITCVNLILSKNIAITSKGTLGEPAAKDLNGQSTGQNGKDGDNLIATSNGYKIFGGNAGEIKINYSKINANFKVTLISKGGDGAKGEDGGDGYRGGQGKPGSDATEDSTPSTGGQGKIGGKGGNGAIGGNGGDGGRILVNQFFIASQDLLNAKDDSNFELISQGGKPGQGGTGGKGAEGGPGGAGGHFGHWVYVPGGGPQGNGYDRWRLKNNRTTSGPDGSKGDDGQNGENGLVGKPGNTAQEKIEIKTLSYYLTVSFVKLLILKGESLYMNGRVTEAAEIFLLVAQLNEIGLNNTTNHLYFKLSKFSFAGLEEKKLLISKAGNYVQRIRLSLDYWGKSLNYVPRLRKDYLKNELNSLVSMAVSFEKVINEFYDKETLSANELEVIKDTQQTLTNSIYALKREFDEKKQFTFNSLQAEIKQASEDIERRMKLLERAEKKFKDALKERNKKKCDVTEVLSAVQMVVSIGTAVSSFGAGLLATANTINTFNELNSNSEDTLKGKWGMIKEVQKIAKEASSSFSSAAASVDKIEENYTNIFVKQKEDLAITTNLIELENEDFEKLMNKYIDMPEARNYKAEMRQYVNAINARNKKRLDYTNNILELDKIRLQVELLEKEQQKILTNEFMTASAKAPAELQLILLNQYYNVRSQIIRLIFLLEKSIEFISLRSRQLSFLDVSIATLQANIIENRIRDLENDNALGNGWILYPDTARVTMTKQTHPLVFTSLDDNNQDYVIDFYISPDDAGFIGEYSNIRIKNVRVFMDNVRYSGDKLSMKLTHLGNSLIKDSDDKSVQFMHDKVELTLDYSFRKTDSQSYNPTSYLDNITGTFEDSEEKYSLISPFANWKLSIKNDANPGINLKNVKKIILAFDFYAGPRT